MKGLFDSLSSSSSYREIRVIDRLDMIIQKILYVSKWLSYI